MCATPSSKLNDPGSGTNAESGPVGRTVMEKFVQRKESNTPCVLDRSHGLNEIAAFRVHRRCQMRYRSGQVVSRLDRSILLMMAGLFFSVSAFSQTPGGPAGPNRTSEHTIQFPAKQDETPVDPQVKFIADRVAAARVRHPSDIEESRRDYLFYLRFAGAPEWSFRVENRFTADHGDVYAPTKWMAEHTVEINQNPKTPLSATPPGTFAFPPTPGSPQTPTSEAYRAGGNIDLTTLAVHFRAALRFHRPN